MPRVYIGRLSYHVREKDIQRFFSGYGKLMEIDLKNGYGFVEFEDNRDADDAVYELNGKELCGERVIVEHARGPRRDRDGYGGGYWGGGRSKCSLLQDTLSSPSPWGEVSMWTAQTAGGFMATLILTDSLHRVTHTQLGLDQVFRYPLTVYSQKP